MEVFCEYSLSDNYSPGHDIICSNYLLVHSPGVRCPFTCLYTCLHVHVLSDPDQADSS